ncbi:hypothetical protein [Tenacibaculum aquimarinum]|uniref:hypothetical protein n=1 Tax=Tenacibaculum aquimarinum TaxID=2910675 RepID=UPI001F0A7132|nr:hypothetical protein [Tenacibaculum aquimarinum]MCH3884385.1 hypothetical protein [Tenacibaculum aquimarinum]
MKNINYLLLIIVILVSCKSVEINDAVIRNSEIKKLNDYNTYVFKLININKTSESKPEALNFSNGVDDNSGLVHEMLYLLRHKTTNEVLYLTTKSHKYIKHGGVFNDELKLYIRFNILNDIDNISIGKEKGQQFVFLDPIGREYSKKVVFSFTEKDDVLKIDSINNNYPIKKDRIKNPFIVLDSVFQTSLKFKANNKKWAYVWEDRKFKRKNTKEYVNDIFINYPYFFVRTKDSLGHFDTKFNNMYYHYKNRKIRKINF